MNLCWRKSCSAVLVWGFEFSVRGGKACARTHTFSGCQLGIALGETESGRASCSGRRRVICHARAVILSVYDRCQIRFRFFLKASSQLPHRPLLAAARSLAPCLISLPWIINQEKRMEDYLGSLILIWRRRGTEQGVHSISSANGYKIACLAS